MNAHPTRAEHGQVTPMIVVFVTAMLLFAGLVFDGGRMLAARREANALAANAARAGAQAVDLDALRSSGAHRLDPSRARAGAIAYLDDADRTGEVTVTDDTVTVTVHVVTEMALLRIAGIDSRDVTGTGTARTLRSVTG